MREPNSLILETIDELPDDVLECALSDFLEEQKLVGEFLVWIEKWKAINGIK
jgi:hypothetical protein